MKINLFLCSFWMIEDGLDYRYACMSIFCIDKFLLLVVWPFLFITESRFFITKRSVKCKMIQ